MKQVFEPYWAWEDFQHGMYDTPSRDDVAKFVALSSSLLTDPQSFRTVAMQMVQAWSVSAAVNLTNEHANRRAWIGQASCCYRHGSPEFATRVAWGGLADVQQDAANAVADEIIRGYSRSRSELHQCLEGQRLFT